jgi:lipopolysaccharide export system permease protein
VNLISRYVFREALGAWLVVIAVLFVILMTDQFAEILADTAADELPREAVFAVFGFSALRYGAILTPIALFLGVMLALARFSRDGEMAALAACGVGPGELLRPLLVLTVVLAAALGWLGLVQTPDAIRRIDDIRAEARAALELGIVEPGVFMTPDQGETTLFAREVVDGELRDVFVHRREGERNVVIVADAARRIVNAAGDRLNFVLSGGRRYEGTPGQANFRMMEFREHGIPVRRSSEESRTLPIEAIPTRQLFGSAIPAERAELEWRLSGPISLFVLVVLAVPLSRSSPRDGRYARLGVALLVYITYVNLLSIGRVWVESSRVPDWLGMWWVHASFGLLGVYLFAREIGWLTRRPLPAAVARP